MKSLISSVAYQSLSAIASELTADLQEDAKKAGWPDEIVSKLSVSITEDGIGVSYPEKLEKQIEDLEYGNSGTPPKPVLRLFDDKHSETIASAISEGLIDELFESDVFP